MNSVRIWWLKHRARKLLRAIYARSDLTCGNALTSYIRPDIAAMEEQFERIRARLATLDPAFPK